MLDKYIDTRAYTQPMLDSTRVVGDHVVYHAVRFKRLVVEVLKATAKCWSFFKDIHFSWYVIIPVTSSITSLNGTVTLILWCLLFLPVLIVITFTALDSLFDLPSLRESSAILTRGLSPLPNEKTSLGMGASSIPAYAHSKRREQDESLLREPPRRHHFPRHMMRSRRSRPL